MFCSKDLLQFLVRCISTCISGVKSNWSIYPKYIPRGREDIAVTDDAKERDVVDADAVLDPAVGGRDAGNLTPSHHGGGARNAGSRRVVIELPETHFVNEC